MKKFAVLLMLLSVSLFSFALIGCGEGEDTTPATGGGGTDVSTPEDTGETPGEGETPEAGAGEEGGDEAAAEGEAPAEEGAEAPAEGEAPAAEGEEAPTP
jgi:hypothetical protein